jgi:ABC-type sugar transport system substrate-binding protein
MNGMNKCVKITVLVMLLLAMVGSVALAGSPKRGADKELKIGVIYLFLRDEYFQSVQANFQRLAEESNVDLMEIDGNFDVGTFAKGTEDMIAAQVDGVIYCTFDPAAAVPQIKSLHEAGIKVIAYNIRPGAGVDVPYIGGSEYENGRDGGRTAGLYFKENFPGQDARIAVTECSFVDASNQRRDGFVVGFKEGAPGIDVQIVGHADKDCSREGSLNAFEDFIQTGTDFNVVYGVNDDAALGSLAALEAANLDDPDKVLTIGYGGSEGAVSKLKDENSSLKVEIGQPPKDNAEDAWKMMLDLIDGKEIPQLVWWKVKVMTPDSPFLNDWVDEQYGLIRK